jgi:hypothetical protein
MLTRKPASLSDRKSNILIVAILGVSLTITSLIIAGVRSDDKYEPYNNYDDYENLDCNYTKYRDGDCTYRQYQDYLNNDF